MLCPGSRYRTQSRPPLWPQVLLRQADVILGHLLCLAAEHDESAAVVKLIESETRPNYWDEQGRSLPRHTPSVLPLAFPNSVVLLPAGRPCGTPPPTATRS